MRTGLTRGKKPDCPIKGDFELCEYVGKGEQKYLKVRTTGKMKPERFARNSEESSSNSSGYKVDAMRKSSAGVKIGFIARLKKLEKDGIPYSAVNEYLRAELGANGGGTLNPLGTGYIVEMITYDPRHDSPISYAEVQQKLMQMPSSINWGSLYDIVDGLNFE